MSRICFRSLILGAALISAAALAQPAALQRDDEERAGVGPLAQFAGSTVSYTNSATAYTFAPGAQPFYDPTWIHQLTLMPQWQPNDWLYLRARLFLAQELTVADDTAYRNEVVLSDTSLDVGTPGWKEPTTGIRLGGYLRLTAPTSKVSLAQTRVLALGPALRLSRSFDVLSGLSVSYTARFTWRFNRTNTTVTSSTPIISCAGPGSTCADYLTSDSTGVRSAVADFVHGPTVVFQPHPKVSVNMVFYWLYYPLPSLNVPAQYADSQALQAQQQNDVWVRDLTSFDLSGTWQVAKPVALTLGLSTFSSQIGAGGYRLFPLVNRDTTVYLDATFDIESTVNAFL